jgi:uncharacterized protein YhaN
MKKILISLLLIFSSMVHAQYGSPLLDRYQRESDAQALRELIQEQRNAIREQREALEQQRHEQSMRSLEQTMRTFQSQRDARDMECIRFKARVARNGQADSLQDAIAHSHCGGY